MGNGGWGTDGCHEDCRMYHDRTRVGGHPSRSELRDGASRFGTGQDVVVFCMFGCLVRKTYLVLDQLDLFIKKQAALCCNRG